MIRVNETLGSYVSASAVTIVGNVGSSGRSHAGTTAVVSRAVSSAPPACEPQSAAGGGSGGPAYDCFYNVSFAGALLFPSVPVASASCSVANFVDPSTGDQSGSVFSNVDVTVFGDHLQVAFVVATAYPGQTYAGALSCVVTQGAVQM